MVRNTSLAAVILLGGGILFLASFAHFFLGMRHIQRLLEAEQSGAELRLTVEAVWIFSSIAMLLCGIWGMFIGISIRKNLRYMRKQAMLLGGGLIVFGAWGFLNPLPNFHLGLFLVVGILIFIPGVMLSKSQGPYF